MRSVRLVQITHMKGHIIREIKQHSVTRRENGIGHACMAE